MAPESPKNLDYDYDLLGSTYANKVEGNIKLIVKWMELGDLCDQCSVENFTLYYNPLQELIADYMRIRHPQGQPLSILKELRKRIDEIVTEREELLSLMSKNYQKVNEVAAIELSLNQLIIQMQEIGDEVLDIFQEDSNFRKLAPEPENDYVANSRFEKVLELGVPASDFLIRHLGDVMAKLDRLILRISTQTVPPDSNQEHSDHQSKGSPS